MKSHRYLDLAKALVHGVSMAAPLTADDGAPECRCAISRAYYAAYNCAVDYLGRIGFKTQNVGACHTAVQHVLNNCGETVLKQVSSKLGTLYTERRNADYEMNHRPSETPRQAEAMVRIAESAVAQLESAASDTGKLGEIAGAILKYIADAGVTAVVRK